MKTITTELQHDLNDLMFIELKSRRIETKFQQI